MPEPLSNQSGAEQELPQYIECLLLSLIHI